MKEFDEKTAEENELNVLISKGKKFTIEYPTLKVKSGLINLFRKPTREMVKKTFVIPEPTLSVLDRMTEIWLGMEFDEDQLLDSSKAFQAARKIAKDNSFKMAQVIAIAVLGEDFEDLYTYQSGKVKRVPNDKKLEDLTDLFYHTIKPSKLYALAIDLTSVSNLGDFLHSTRLMGSAKTTKAIRVEQQD